MHDPARVQQHAERLLQAQSIRHTLTNAHPSAMPVPPEHVAAVLHALADHTHNRHMLHIARDEVLARDTDLEPPTDSLGRYFHALADWIDGRLGYVVCNRLLDPEDNLHCEFDGRVLLNNERRGRCPWCHGFVVEETPTALAAEQDEES